MKVVTPYGEILWARLGWISDEEMKLLMIVLRYVEELAAESAQTRRWNRPKVDRDLMIGVRFRCAARRL